MESVTEGPLLPYRILEQRSSSETEDGNPTDAVVFVGICLVLGIASRHLLRGTRVPYTVALLIIGIALGSLEYGTSHRLGKVGDGIRLWANIDPDLLLAVFLPALLFESSSAMEPHQIKRCMVQMVLLAVPGVLISTFLLGAAVKLTFPYHWSWKTSLLLGGLLSATDPVAVVALLKELGASKKLNTIIEGESLMNDGTAIVVYQLFYRMVIGKSFSWGSIVKFVVQVTLGAVGMGLAFGTASVLWLGFIFNDTVIGVSLTLAVSYVAYFTAQEGAGISGVLTVMTLGMFYAAVARTAFKGESQQSLHYFWEMVAYIANTLIFILSGAIIAEGVLNSDKIFENHGISWGYLILLYVFVQISRSAVVGLLYPFLQYFGYGLDWKEATILIWSGLRGAVALALSLSFKLNPIKDLKKWFNPVLLHISNWSQRSSNGSSNITSDTGTLFVFFTGGIVFLTLIVNGSTTQCILRFLEMDKLSVTQRHILDCTKYKMLNKASKAFDDLSDDEELGPADWATVKRYITGLNDLEGECKHSYNTCETDNNLDPTNSTDIIRIRFLNGVKAAYWGMLDEGRITQNVATILMQSVDEAIDLAFNEPLCDWKGLKANVNFPYYYKFLQARMFHQKLVTYLTVERLESACYICAAFLLAHRIARQQLHDFIGDKDIASNVIEESKLEGEEAKMFLEDVSVTFPQVLHVVKTRQVTYSVLNHLINYVQNLEKVGLLEEKEMLPLHDAVQTDLKRLLRNPPLVKFPKIKDLGALPSNVCEPLASFAKEIMKVRGVTLYKEGSRPNGIWLISNGIVKWTSKSIKNNYSLHPTFTHGSTLGLYEVLTVKPYICDMVTDSVVRCFFIESEKILSVLNSDLTVENSLWQESAIVLVRLLLPQLFENLTMQELRVLVAERSRMTTYSTGESIEIPLNSIGFLLEGSVKTHGLQEEPISSPASLFPSQGNLSFRSVETSGIEAADFSHQGSGYQAEKTARVIIFDNVAFETNSGLLGSSSLSLSNSGDQPHRPLSKEHGNLMSWREHFFKARQHKQHPEATDHKANSLSARAMQLSTVGSKVDIPRCPRSCSYPSEAKPAHSLSYPRVASYHGYPLTSGSSEGDATVRKKLESSKSAGQIPSSSLRFADTNERHAVDDSSDDSIV